MNYARHYQALIDRSHNRRLGRAYVERHHVVPRCLGGGDEPSNLVRLTAEEHCIAHILLAKMYPEEEKIVFAASMMAGRVPVSGMTKNKRYGKMRRARSKWIDRRRRGNAIRAMKRNQKGYSKTDVARLAEMLKPTGTKLTTNR